MNVSRETRVLRRAACHPAKRLVSAHLFMVNDNLPLLSEIEKVAAALVLERNRYFEHGAYLIVPA